MPTAPRWSGGGSATAHLGLGQLGLAAQVLDADLLQRRRALGLLDGRARLVRDLLYAVDHAGSRDSS
ncbi:MAG: hypothetical protein U0S48_16505 [Solirubrobacteraceae bacterium]